MKHQERARHRLLRIVLGGAISAGGIAVAAMGLAAHAHDGHRPPPPPPRYHSTVVIDRSRPGWWRGNPAFVGYIGPRPGYYFAPGYGYYPVPRGYTGRVFVVGTVVPPPMRTYVVVRPTVYGLRPPPPGYRWYYAGTSFVLAATSNGVIVQAVVGGW